MHQLDIPTKPVNTRLKSSSKIPMKVGKRNDDSFESVCTALMSENIWDENNIHISQSVILLSRFLKFRVNETREKYMYRYHIAESRQFEQSGRKQNCSRY